MSVETALKSQEYLTSDYCFSCAYFSNRKGHFGQCSENLSKRPYDGTKFGTSCIGWRKKSDWIDIEFKHQVPPERTRHKLVRSTHAWWKKEVLGSVTDFPLEVQKRIWAYDRQLKIDRRRATEEERVKKRELAREERVKKRELAREERVKKRELAREEIYLSNPACLNCGIQKCTKHGLEHRKGEAVVQRFNCANCGLRFIYPRLVPRYTKEIVDFALTLYESGSSLRQTARLVNEKFEVTTTSTTIFNWINRFRPDVRRRSTVSKRPYKLVSIKPLFFQPLPPCDRCGSSNSRRNGSTHGLQEYRCKDCGHRFSEKRAFKGFRYDEHTIKYAIELVSAGLSLRETCKKIENTMHKSITSAILHRWVHRFRPELDLAKRKKIGYYHTSAEQKALLRLRVLEHNARYLPDCKCTYHKAHSLEVIAR